MDRARKVAVVVPRFGEGIVGGAETLAAFYAGALTEAGWGVEVLTTTAKSADSWEPALPAGTTETGGVTVRRFDTVPRDWKQFERAARAVRDGDGSLDTERAFIMEMGYSPGLLDYVARRSAEYHRMIFLPYLFASTVLGVPATERAILVPCLHDEPWMRLGLVGRCFGAARAVWYNSLEEQALGVAQWGRSGPVVGMGFAEPVGVDADGAFRRRYGLPARYLLYVGRLESGKGVDTLLGWYRAYRRTLDPGDRALPLVLAGSGRLDGRGETGVLAIGVLSEADKQAAYRGAYLLCQPSVMESLSIVLMEAWLWGTPAVVRAGSPVTTGHVRRSGGGLVVASAGEFAAAVHVLAERVSLRDTLGSRGRQYVRMQYGRDRVIRKLVEEVDRER